MTAAEGETAEAAGMFEGGGGGAVLGLGEGLFDAVLRFTRSGEGMIEEGAEADTDDTLAAETFSPSAPNTAAELPGGAGGEGGGEV